MKKPLQDEVVITLRKPVTLGTGAEAMTYESIELREPIAEEVLEFNRQAKVDAGEALRKLIARISGAPISVIGKIKARDFNRASNYLLAFIDPDSDGDDEEEGAEAEGK